MIRNIIFDWSGTLVDDLPAVWQATNYVLRQAGRAELTLDQFRAEFSLPFTDFYDRHTPHVALPQLETWFHGHFRQTQDSVVPLPHAREFLEFCRAQKIRTFILSTVAPEHFAKQERSSGFAEFIEKPYVGIVDKRKVIQAILTENNLRPDETAFIGDMQHDIETAKHGGVHSIAVLTGYNRLAQLRDAEPDLIVQHLSELQQHLQRQALQLTAPTAVLPIATVGGLIFNDAGEVLMIQTHKWSNRWGIPGGKIKWGETSEAALVRELKEEADLDVTDIRFILAQDCIHSKEFYRDAHFVLLNYTCRATGKIAVKLNEEAHQFKWASPAEALQMEINEPTRTLLQAVAPK